MMPLVFLLLIVLTSLVAVAGVNYLFPNFAESTSWHVKVLTDENTEIYFVKPEEKFFFQDDNFYLRYFSKDNLDIVVSKQGSLVELHNNMLQKRTIECKVGKDTYICGYAFGMFSFGVLLALSDDFEALSSNTSEVLAEIP